MSDEKIGAIVIAVLLASSVFFVLTAWPLLLLGMVLGLGTMCFLKD